MRSIYLIPILLLTVASAAFAEKERIFDATAFEYNVAAKSAITSKTFTSHVTVFEQGSIKIVQLKNFINNKNNHDVLLKIVISGNSVGSIVYNSKMEIIAEYSKGKIENEYLYLFSAKNKKNTIKGSWYIEDDFIMSDFSIVNESGAIIYKETVIYRAQDRKKKVKPSMEEDDEESEY